jgi:hypothetical protein
LGLGEQRSLYTHGDWWIKALVCFGRPRVRSRIWCSFDSLSLLFSPARALNSFLLFGHVLCLSRFLLFLIYIYITCSSPTWFEKIINCQFFFMKMHNCPVIQYGGSNIFTCGPLWYYSWNCCGVETLLYCLFFALMNDQITSIHCVVFVN